MTKIVIVSIFASLQILTASCAAYILSVAGKTYTNAVLKKEYQTTISIGHDEGFAFIDRDKLAPEQMEWLRGENIAINISPNEEAEDTELDKDITPITDLPEFHQAAEQGDPAAQYALGVSYYQGVGVPKSKQEAYLWLSLAATEGNTKAAKLRDKIEKLLPPTQLAEAQSRTIKMFKKIKGMTSNAVVATELRKGESIPSSGITESGPLTQKQLNAIVTISGKSSGGTGFICEINGEIFVATNQHVLDGMENVKCLTMSGAFLTIKKIKVADDRDLALLKVEGIPQDITPLTILASAEYEGKEKDAVCIPGNSLGDGVITQTHGTLLALGPRRIEFDCPIYGGNSGSPVIHRKTGAVVGVATEAMLRKFDDFEKASFRNKKSTIKSEIRYFGYRLDSANQWTPLVWNYFQLVASDIEKTVEELGWVTDFYTGASDSYKEFAALHRIHNDAVESFSGGIRLSPTDAGKVMKRLLWNIDGRVKKSIRRVTPHTRKIQAYVHQGKLQNIEEWGTNLNEAIRIARRDEEITQILLERSR